jgi:L-alanine-DL-glutamate epimerase-like enolase superfamily enzyme
MAMWDAVAKIEEKPLWQLLSERYNKGRHDDRVLVYPGGGYYYPGRDIEQLQSEMRAYREQGYRIVKMKIGGAPLDADIRRIEAVLEVVGSGDSLAVDANGRFDLTIDFATAAAPYKLCWFEEPGDPLDFALNAELAKRYDSPIATGENLFSAQDAKNLALYGGMRTDRDWIQLDPALAYGLTEYLKMLALLEPLGWVRRRHVPHGGHLLGLHMAAGLQLGGTETYPLVFQPFGGFSDGAAVENGFTAPPMAPGLGVEQKSELIKVLRPLTDG